MTASAGVFNHAQSVHACDCTQGAVPNAQKGGQNNATTLTPPPIPLHSDLSDDVGEGFVQFLVEVGQLLEVAVVLMDGDHDFVHLIHCLKQPRLQKTKNPQVPVWGS